MSPAPTEREPEPLPVPVVAEPQPGYGVVAGGTGSSAGEAVASQLPAQPGPPGAEFESHAARPDRDGITPHGPGRGEGPSTRRRSVVFEEDDELDVPDFLK